VRRDGNTRDYCERAARRIPTYGMPLQRYPGLRPPPPPRPTGFTVTKHKNQTVNVYTRKQ